MGVAVLTLVADHTQDMGLMALLIDGIAHGFTIDSQGVVFLGIGFVPPLQGTIQLRGVDPKEDLTDTGFTGDEVAALGIATTESLSGMLAKTFGPIGDRAVSPHAT